MQKRAVIQYEGTTENQEKFINYLMQDGKKSIARKIFADMLKSITEKTAGKKNAVEVFNLALSNVMPNVEVRAKRVGGAVYQVPREVPPKRQLSLAIRWLVQTCRKKSGKPMAEQLASEVLNASEMNGDAYKKKEDVHRMAQANKAFAHLANY